MAGHLLRCEGALCQTTMDESKFYDLIGYLLETKFPGEEAFHEPFFRKRSETPTKELMLPPENSSGIAYCIDLRKQIEQRGKVVWEGPVLVIEALTFRGLELKPAIDGVCSILERAGGVGELVLPWVHFDAIEALGQDIYSRWDPENWRNTPRLAEWPSCEEVKASRVLKDYSARNLLRKLRDNPKDPEKRPRFGRPELEDIDSMEKVGLVRIEWTIQCNKEPNRNVLRCSDIKSLDRLTELGVRCGCGQDLGFHSQAKDLIPTPLGESLMDGSRWMTVLVLDELRKLGVPKESISVGVKIRGEECDLCAEIGHNLFLFELKDDTFSIGHAKALAITAQRLEPNWVVIVTSRVVERGAKEIFHDLQEDRPDWPDHPDDEEAYHQRLESAVSYIEGLDNLAPGLCHIVDIMSERLIYRIMGGPGIEAFVEMQQWPLPDYRPELVKLLKKRCGPDEG